MFKLPDRYSMRYILPAVYALLLASLIGIVPSQGQTTARDLIDDFDTPHLKRHWNPKYALPGLFESGVMDSNTGTTYLSNKMTEAHGTLSDDPHCQPGQSTTTVQDPLESREDFGPSLVAQPQFPTSADTLPCHSGIRHSNGCEYVQRNELRLRGSDHVHATDQTHWYQVRFKTPGPVFQCGSARAITAQWKYDPPGWPTTRPSPSPFVAQRFDNGVLHVSVQVDDCRCLIAKADGDPDALQADATMEIFGLRQKRLRDVAPLRCKWFGQRKDEGSCKEFARQNLFLEAYSETDLESLPDPKTQWVDMMYKVKSGPTGDGLVEIYANNRFIVRAKGLIGYRGYPPGTMKFKFGHYRIMVPGDSELAFDRVCLSADAQSCDPALKPVP